MKIEIPPLTGVIHLSDYAPELGEQTLTVWLNPPSGLLREYDDCFRHVMERNEQLKALVDPPPNGDLRKAEDLKEQATALASENKPDVDRMLAIVAELLSAGPEETRFRAEELNAMIEGLADANPGFYFWVVRRVFARIGEYRAWQKKT